MILSAREVDWAVPDWIRHPRLEGVFGVRRADITWEHIVGLVDRVTAEDLSIDETATAFAWTARGAGRAARAARRAVVRAAGAGEFRRLAIT